MLKLGIVALLAAATLSACATRPIPIAAASAGDGVAKMTPDGAIRVTVRSPDAFGMGKDGVVTFKPGDPAYELMREQIDAGAGKNHKPILIWEIGTPEYVTPAPPKP